MFEDFIRHRNNAWAIFQAAYATRLSIENARKRFNNAMLRDIDACEDLEVSCAD